MSVFVEVRCLLLVGSWLSVSAGLCSLCVVCWSVVVGACLVVIVCLLCVVWCMLFVVCRVASVSC